MTTLQLPTNRIQITRLPGQMPANFTSRMFPGANPIICEHRVFSLMMNISENYKGGLWSAYEATNGALFMAPSYEGRTLCRWPMNYFEGEMSWEAAGLYATILGTLIAYEECNSDALATAHHRLMDLVGEHEEAEVLYRALD